MLEITKQRTPVERVERRIEFDYNGDSNSCISFEADESWNPIFKTDLQRSRYEAGMRGEEGLVGPHKRTFTISGVEPAEGKCRCGATVVLQNQYMGACECPECGQWYNLFGQELRDPEHWDTGNEDY